MRSVWKFIIFPRVSENDLVILTRRYIKLQDLVGAVALEGGKKRILTVPVYSSTPVKFDNMEEIHEHYQRSVW